MDDAALERWLLAGDPAVRWQTLRDLTHAPEAEVAAARAQVLDGGGWAAALLGLQHEDGNWGVGVYDGDDWDSTTDALWILRELDVDPTDPRVAGPVRLVAEHVRWEERHGGRLFFEGETEACVNGRVAALGAWSGFPSPALIDRLVSEQLPDGGWNCEAPASSRSSFHSTICVLEGLLEFERAAEADGAVTGARRRGEEYLLERGLLRARSSGRVIDAEWLVPHVPTYWCHDVLRGLEHLRATGAPPDPRLADAVAVLRRARDADGTWHAATHPGRPVLDLEPAEGANRLATLRALRVLAWADAAELAGA